MMRLYALAGFILALTATAYSQALVLPPLQDPFNFQVTPGTADEYPESYSMLYGFPGFRCFGWSRDGKIAFSIEHDSEARGGRIYSFFIQDLIQDRIIWKTVIDDFDPVEGEVSTTLDTPEKAYAAKWSEITRALRSNSIIYQSSSIQKMPIIIGEETIEVSGQIVVLGKNEIDLQEIGYSIIAEKIHIGKKVIRKVDSIIADRIHICGWLKSPWENRVAVIIAEECYVFEGNELFYHIIGCSIIAGYR